MKAEIHPKYHMITVVMTDGTEYQTRSTWGKAGDKLNLDIDSKSHPAWIGGAQQLLDRGGRVAVPEEVFGLSQEGVRPLKPSHPNRDFKTPQLAPGRFCFEGWIDGFAGCRSTYCGLNMICAPIATKTAAPRPILMPTACSNGKPARQAAAASTPAIPVNAPARATGLLTIGTADRISFVNASMAPAPNAVVPRETARRTDA